MFRLGIALTIAVRLQAQADSGTVTGTVFDSVNMKPAVGASVQLVARDDRGGAVFSALSDARGRFEIRAPVGQYIIGFLHSTLDSLNIRAPYATVSVASGATARADLAVPTPSTILAAVCGHHPRDSIGAVVGFLRDARTGAAIDSGRVFAEWVDLVIGPGAIGMEERSTNGKVSDGAFLLCGVGAAGGDAFLVANDGVDTTGAILVDIPKHGLLRQDFWLGGRVPVRITVSSEKGPVVNAETWLAGSIRPGHTDSAGVFQFPGARAGTQTLDVRAIGYVPERIPVVLMAGRDTAVDVRLTTFRKMMDTIHIVAQRVYSADVRGFEARRRRGNGTFFDDATIQRRGARTIFDLLRVVPGVQIRRVGFNNRIIMGRGQGNCVPAVFLDGMKMMDEMSGDLDMLVSIEEVGGVEVYRGSYVPPQFSGFNNCGAIVIWTRAPLPRKGR